MVKQNGTDFAVDSEGNCFLCSKKIFKSHAIHSFHNVSKYLKMDMTKVFSETGGIPPRLLAKVQASRLKVELCEECAALNETFSKHYRRLEKIEMEVASCANQMYGKLSAVREHDRDSRMTSGRDVSEKSKILKALRTEAGGKCLSKLAVGSPYPRIKLRKLTLKQVKPARPKFQIQSGMPQWTSRNNQDQESGSDPIENLSDENMDSDVVTCDGDFDANNDFDEYDGEPNEHDVDVQVAMQLQADEVTDGAYSVDATKDETTPKVKIDKTLYTVSAGTGKYKCNSCAKELKDFGGFRSHYKSMHLKIRYKCSMCGKVLQTNTNYNRHVQSAHLGIMFKCQGCGRDFNRKDALKRHQRLSNCAAAMASAKIKDEPIS